ncbi:carboxymuconolactone decarboxylase family protein [Corynebacterium sp.]|uniref:carboxymuconolactone decarboxylase family protein n=1 Tax=Corynebacterium sp. TaxID=1720 RepID=UPI002A916E29|nr:carboxymuconolactone decarboxylase family protein [Corynebacterium sp.]MDY5786462.1 carboxymuconolactone decarboxylase family protein [Corynebacterium sp.]
MPSTGSSAESSDSSAQRSPSRPQLRGEGMRSLLPMVKYSSAHTPEKLRHLVSLRASALNDCRACITTHRRDARTDGLTEERILRAEDWTNYSSCYDAEEILVLRLTDAITHIDGEESVPDELWDAAVAAFGIDGTHAILVSILAINSFNRLSITTRTNPHDIKVTTEFDLDYSAHL